METKHTQINTKEKSASGYASFFKSSILKCSKTMLASLFILFFAGNLLAQSGDFVTKWNLATSGSGTNQLSFTTTNNGTVNYKWETIPSGSADSGTLSISSGVATISGLPTGATIRLRIKPTNFKRFAMSNQGDKDRLLDVEQWGTAQWSSMASAFFGCRNLTITATDIPNLSSVTNTSSMFEDCRNITTVPNINSWNVSNVTNMTSLFKDARKFNQNIGSWNTAKVTTMQNLFGSASLFNQNIGGWNTSNVVNMSGMFGGASAFNQDISGWNTAKVSNMQNMFNWATSFNQNLGSWTLNANVNMANMLDNTTSLHCNNYSATLIGWSSTSTTGRSLGARGNAGNHRTYGAYAESARTTLTTSTGSGGKGWTISDGGLGTCNDPRLSITQTTGVYNYLGVRVNSNAVDNTWQVTPSTNLTNAAITFTWPTSLEMTGFTRGLLGVYTRTSGVTGAGNWTFVNSGSATTSGSNHSFSVSGLTLNSSTNYYYGVSNNITPLPVSIIGFKGFVKNDVINLEWIVTDEKDLSRYDIYSSIDGINFSLCGSVVATMPERGLKTYQFQDLSKKAALVYYRMQAINNDETGDWSSIVAVNTNKSVENKPLKVYPNPATDFISLEFDGIDASNFNVLVMDMSGKVVYKLDGVETEINQYVLPLNGIQSGMYIVQLSDEFGNTKINRFSIK